MKLQKSGFTLIEIVVVMAVMGILLPTVFSVMYIIMQQQLAAHKLSETKQQGDLVMNYMKQTITQEAGSIASTSGFAKCSAPNTTHSSTLGEFNFALDDSSTPDMFSFRVNAGELVFEEYSFAPLLGVYQTDSSLNLNNSGTVAITNFLIECRKRDDYSFPLVSFSFDATFVDTTPTAQEGVVTLHYQTKIKLR
ncbi:hypothetical protein COU87_04910 [Candidatus Roizmanbacteria bacterium CG10_big_fil_rev_8_21_14_0_10_39_12]|uniref:Type II secretion system protein n=1 Tax=Candidatus Roizmanbacteria bacterium CG10_big_fil_rev_8_21_14_0_10_39_12 TaxID=1974852 RepID=A0A2M8KN68_9BACT|nr:MAG: hypothetical protein COY15_02470 [Candidatus Roizmanbacteria bacterium CG_4_10_14_0_2_um_filter_39_12]PJE61366.1 MAG: hypothetical protein COU87_04910 [Candidatus Roizmanbacteria bacterium CG10_big_fil_rev_8_21_14_0_10_39_12]